MKVGKLVWLILLGLYIVPQIVLAASTQRGELAELADGNTAFSLALYEHLRDEPGNLVLSPFSISAALGMTYAGALGETAAQMADVLRFTLPEARTHQAFRELLAELDGSGKDYELAVANSLWGQRGYDFLQGFLAMTSECYGAGLQEVDFRGDAEAARREINAWVADKTRQRIEELLAPGMVGSFTRLVLVNAIYFYSDWALQFDPEYTEEADFHLSTEETVKVPMMRQRDTFRYAGFADLQALELPYEGGDVSMVVLLPARGVELGNLEQRLTAERLAEWMEELERMDVRVHLPKFAVRTRFALAEALSEMGMPLAFSEEADFSGMTGERDIFVDEVIHEAFIGVHEAGTEAAAATAVTMLGAAPPGPEPVEFRADRPFVFLLRHRSTGSILFMGRVVDPS